MAYQKFHLLVHKKNKLVGEDVTNTWYSNAMFDPKKNKESRLQTTVILTESKPRGG